MGKAPQDREKTDVFPVERTGENAQNGKVDRSPATLVNRLKLALAENPDYVSVTEAALILRISKTTLYQCYRDLPTIVRHGVHLYSRAVVEERAKTRTRKQYGSRLIITGIKVERLQRICEYYYRTQYDSGPPELLALARKIAQL